MWQTWLHNLEQLVAVLTAGSFEGTGIPWPGGVIIAAAGAAAGDGWLTLVVLAGIFSAGYTVGALLQYSVGRALGPAALGWLPAAHRARLEAVMHRYGSAAVLWSRPLAIGNYVSVPAGMMHMPLGRFVAYTFAGIWPWSFGTLMLGQLLGSRLGALPALLAAYTLPAVVVLGGATLCVAGWRMLRRRSNRVAVAG